MGRDNDFEGKVIALTGGASGIGLATARMLHARGASVAIADIDQAALDNAAQLLSSASERVQVTKLDVSDNSAVTAWTKSILEEFGKLDGAANCAGVIGKHHGTRKLSELEDDQWDLIMGVNLTGMMYCMRAELQAMKGPGSVVCVSSVQGTLGFAKHAAGSIETPLMHKRNALEGVDPSYTPTPINRLGTSEECGNLIAWLLSDESTFVSGATYSVDGGWAC
ncbi:hypothetical protein D0864_11360 [Hortaea werneckii]|uniref:Uncharacterized protein n=1 Tax=Hortaea werneckii TaxID=91943 RepID=A0A3M7DWU1_HORWE|nr:hypothetical protein D0864_11360 [Hortaea werneckii]